MKADSDLAVRRELDTVGAMMRMYCEDRHGIAEGLCAECHLLLDYAAERLARCPMRPDKPTRARCPVHCYRPALRESIRQVMQYAGPRMPFRHPGMASERYRCAIV